MRSDAWRNFRAVHDVRRRAAAVEVDFGAGARRLPPGTRVLDLTPAGGLVPADGPVNWAALPHCLTVEWSGADRGVAEAVAARPGIRYLYWRDAVGDVDLTRTRLIGVRLGGPLLRGVRLPDGAESVQLRETAGDLRVEAADEGHRVALGLFSHRADIAVPAGLRRVPSVWIRAGAEFSMAALDVLTDLRKLRLGFSSPPGTVTGLDALRRHGGLHDLELDDAYGLDPDAVPDLPHLGTLTLNGTRRTIAARLRRRFRAGGVVLSVSGAKTEAWLAEYMHNPFRDWVHESERFGRAACEAYDRAASAIGAAGPDAPERALRGLVADLNRIDGEIETMRREHAWRVFMDLGARMGVPEAQLNTWFDEDRRF